MSADTADMTRDMLERLMVKYRDHLPMWVITKHPTDYPGDYVARLNMTLPVHVATGVVLRRATLEDLREALPRGLHRLDRSASDNPNIVEVWL